MPTDRHARAQRRARRRALTRWQRDALTFHRHLLRSHLKAGMPIELARHMARITTSNRIPPRMIRQQSSNHWSVFAGFAGRGIPLTIHFKRWDD